MNLTHLRAFREVMRSASISQAARRLGRTQPAVSQAIKLLEEELGLTLFVRQGRDLIPVPEAEYLLIEAESILDRLAVVSRTMKGLVNHRAGELSIAAMPGPSMYLLPAFVSRMLRDRPAVRVSLSARSSQQIRELVSTQSIDFGFADLLPQSGPTARYRVERIVGDCFCALPKAHPLAARATLSYRDLDGMPMATLHSDHVFCQRVRDAFQAEGAACDVVLESQTFLPTIPFVADRRCTTIVDPLTVATAAGLGLAAGDVVFRPLDPPLRYEYALLSPAFRPLSQLATHVKDCWIAEVLDHLHALSANPVRETIEGR